ncbi:hypothetical protein [Variovorax paradoxus]|uniref:hypothetical protein n=1 Tax=Variovorax paradoxus TaxID=34073 RepID=UPI00247894B4
MRALRCRRAPSAYQAAGLPIARMCRKAARAAVAGAGGAGLEELQAQLRIGGGKRQRSAGGAGAKGNGRARSAAGGWSTSSGRRPGGWARSAVRPLARPWPTPTAQAWQSCRHGCR